ncbi:IPT/TIG domain-containing protein [Cryptosporangium aurantiacum]|uniref:IPT/TIG domain-containing protein n=1 Tax=Cryptosporangium aurantiacum TaxID=134849 RepID=UPI0015BF13FD|nr:IPT/TIG domain-containing protein [Cryptosporangium aurantiacum]
MVSDKKLVVEAPAALATVAAGTTYNVCVYNATVGSSGLAIATSTYKVYQAPTITGITPASGPALGGGQVVIGGTGFSTNTRVTIGGQALVSATVNAAAGTITGTMPSHAAGQVDVVVTSEGGPATMVNGYTYIDGISVTPSTTTTRGAVILDIFGAGFKASSLAWNNNALPTRSLGSVATSQIAVNNTITLAGHALANGDRVRFDGLTGAAPLESGKAYYVINSNTGAGTFEVAATPGGTAIDIQTVSSGGTARDISRLGLTPATGGGVGTFTVATGVVSALVGHTLEDGDRVMLSGFTGGLGGVSPWTWYYVNTADSATGTFKLAATRGGTALAFTATGATGTAMVWVPDELTHVIVSRGAYDDAATPGQPGWIAGECTNVQVISDTEIICKLDASTFAPTAGAHQITVIDDMRAGPTATSPGGPTRTTVVTSPSTFTFAPY